jgi:DtxR family transcriptional regulator, Mn-dependent transcriptional regulator
MPHKPRCGDLSPNMEDYLETIYLQDIEGRAAKVKNIADTMSVSKPSVTEALSVLQERGLVLHQKYGDIELTEKGRTTAAAIYRRHCLFTEFFKDVLGVSPKQAEDDACKVEHLVSEETTLKVEALLKFLKNAKNNGSDFREFVKEFQDSIPEVI